MSTPAPRALDPHRTALLVIDYQNGVVSRIPDADPLLDRVADAIATVRAHDGQVGYVRVLLRKVFPRQARVAVVAELTGLFRQDR